MINDTNEHVVLNKSFLRKMTTDELQQLYFNCSGRAPEGLSRTDMIDYISDNFYRK